MGSSFIRCLLQDLRFQGSIYNLDALTYAANFMNLGTFSDDPRYRFIEGNILDKVLLQRLHSQHNFHFIVHFAAETHVDRSIASPRTFLETNILGTFELLQLVRENPGLHFHHVSTDEVYGALGSDGAFHEKSPYLPNSPYSASKAASDHLVRSYVQTYGICATVSHACNNYGPGQYPEKLIPLMIERASRGAQLPIYGEGREIREWLYVDDHSCALIHILEKGLSGEVYNISGEKEITNIELVRYLLKKMASFLKQPYSTFESLITFVENRPGHDYRYALSSKKMRELGWASSVSLDEGLERTICWYLNPVDIKIV